MVFGADCLIQTVRQVFDGLFSPEFSHVGFYRTCLHSSRYVVQYVKHERDYIRTVQEDHCRKLARAKGHEYLKGGKPVFEAVGKGSCFDPSKRRSTASQGPEDLGPGAIPPG